MTVLSPVPARVAGNRIIPFRQVQYVNKVRPVALKDWKPPVPEPLPPAPLLGLTTLAALGLQALAQLWGRINSKLMPPPYEGTAEFTSPVAQDYVVRYRSISYTSQPKYCVDDKNYNSPSSSDSERQWSESGRFGIKYEFTGQSGSMTCGAVDSGNYADWVKISVQDTKNGPWVKAYSAQHHVGTWGGNTFYYVVQTSQRGAPVSVTGGGKELSLPTLGKVDPRPGTSSFPQVKPPTVKPLPLPGVQPAPSPEVVPSPEPEPEALPQPLPVAIPGRAPVKIPGSTSTANGTVVKPAALPVPVTDPGSVVPWPGAPAIPGTGVSPRPDLVGIAQEVGKIERKLEMMNTERPTTPDNPLDLVGLARAIYELLMGTLLAPTYTLDSPCEVDADGKKLPPVEVPVGPAFTAIGSVAERIDALAELLQVHKNLKQPNCSGDQNRATFSGEPVTVNFVSTLNSPSGTGPLRKELSYRDQTGADVCAHANHWDGFSWKSGPVQVQSKGLAWGQIQVWAVSADEGKRVIAHAAQVAGVNLSDQRHRWVVATTQSSRNGVKLEMVPQKDQWGAIRVSKRAGSSGPPPYPYA